MIYNPPESRLPHYYTGLTDHAEIRRTDEYSETIAPARDSSAEVTVNVPAHGRVWLIVGAPQLAERIKRN
jgi:hypothetical protein